MKILLIDDDHESLEALNMILSPTEHECRTFENPVKAIEDFKKNDYDVIITDISMPEMSGIEVLKVSKQINPDIYVILITGYRDLEAAIDAVNNKAFAFFDKPVNVEGLLDTIDLIEEEKKGFKNKEEEYKKISNDLDKLRSTVDELTKIYNSLMNK